MPTPKIPTIGITITTQIASSVIPKIFHIISVNVNDGLKMLVSFRAAFEDADEDVDAEDVEEAVVTGMLLLIGVIFRDDENSVVDIFEIIKTIKSLLFSTK
ncbi:14106_t:CDS:2 [Ambispora leptoticha]|uniref:14106_t:CDS:1 n=1 Tax=Ambispora leptoticha TaxID=144679 RepID=A0A9N9B4U1_9GLOM|nr:14106_t:CDS:2 [Ambispora leptoticha]